MLKSRNWFLLLALAIPLKSHSITFVNCSQAEELVLSENVQIAYDLIYLAMTNFNKNSLKVIDQPEELSTTRDLLKHGTVICDHTPNPRAAAEWRRSDQVIIFYTNRANFVADASNEKNKELREHYENIRFESAILFLHEYFHAYDSLQDSAWMYKLGKGQRYSFGECYTELRALDVLYAAVTASGYAQWAKLNRIDTVHNLLGFSDYALDNNCAKSRFCDVVNLGENKVEFCGSSRL